ncbi:MAG: LysM peptidoglycan-binding domain-containing protein [Halieaceae bacterium]|nr:LysM peptidoglycan-binding domain-containing protein [Halieaceae bacterium]
MKKISFWLCLLLMSLSSGGWRVAAIELNDEVPQTYIVKKGDTLWGISEIYLKQPWLWPELWGLNPQIDNPNLIYPGDKLHLEWVNGQPRLQVSRGRDVKLSPNMRVLPLDLAIPAIPLDEIGAFLRDHRVLGADDIVRSAYVVAGAQGHLLSAPGDRIFGRGSFPDGERVYGIFRPGAVYRDPVTSEVLGYQAQDIGSATLISDNKNEVVELQISRIAEEVRVSDRLLPNEEQILDATFRPRAPEQEIVDGFMIAVDGGVSQIGSWDIVVLNRGNREGMEVGHVLAIYQTGALVYDDIAKENVVLPDARAGLLMVFKVFEKVSYAIVLKENRPLKVLDKIRNP